VTTNDSARDLIDQIVSAYNSRTTDVLSEVYHPDVTYWSVLGNNHVGRQAVIDNIEKLHIQLPDEQMRAQSVTADDDMIVVEFESTGTGPSGDAYRIEFTEVFEIVDGKVASIKVYIDPDEVAAISV
jgi:ketosteroid isomerase-like protein